MVQKFAVILLLSLIIFGDGQARADDGRKLQYKTSKELYDKCKVALSSDSFEGSFCAAYIEGYIGSRSIALLFALSLADNQREIMDESHKNKCTKISENSYSSNGIKWLASFFVNWIDNNQDVIAGESSFLDREASTILHVITTDERFCINSEKTTGEK